MICTSITRHARDQLRRAIAGTRGGQERSVPTREQEAPDATQADSNIGHLRATRILTPRQCDAAAHLARLWGLGGHSTAWRTTGGGERPEAAVAAARAEYAALVDATPARCRQPLDVLCMGEWPVTYDPLPLWREGLDIVADRLRLAL